MLKTHRLLALGVGLVVLAAMAFASVLYFQLPNPETSIAIDDIGEAVAAFIAAGACWWAATRTLGRTRLGWALLAISAGAWGVGEATWSVYEVGLKVAVPFPGWPDVGFVAAIPFAVAGIRSFWTGPRGTATRWRVWLDGAIIALALLYTAWVLGLRLVWADFDDPLLERFLDLVYPVGDILIGTVLILGIRRAAHWQQARLFVLLGGVAANSVANSAFAYLTANGSYTAHGSVLDTGWFVGYLMIGLAAIWPRTKHPKVETAPVDLLQAILPWLAVLTAGLSALGLAVSGQGLDRFLALLTGVGIILLTTATILTSRDFLAMLIKSRRSEATLSDVVNRAPIGIARADTNFTIIDANPALEELLRERPRSMLGLPFDRYIPAEDQQEVFQKMETLASGDAGTVEGECPLIRSDGSRVWSHWTSTAVKDAAGATDYYLTMLEDVDARHQAEESAKGSLATLERLNSLKTEFLQNVSHEFKTALIGIQGFSEFMRDADQLSVDDARAFAADINRDAERLDRMVTEMLSLDQVEKARSNFHVGPVDMNALIRREADATREQVHTNVLVLNLDPSLPMVSGDEEKLGEVVRTLLSNAVRYSPEKGLITVTSALSGSTVAVGVRDQGVAARADFDSRLFGHDDLYADNPIRKVVGTGLGLGIVRQVVEIHGGRVWVDRLDGQGSVFHFTVPVAAAVAAGPASGMVA